MNKILLRRGNKVDLERVNPVLSQGEPLFIIDENKLKVGDGSTSFNDLPYLDIGERIIETIREQIVKPTGGITKVAVQKMIDSAIADISGGGGTLTTLESSGGSILFTPIPGGYNLEVAAGTSAGIQGRYQLSNAGTTFTINHSAIDPLNEFPVASLEVATSGSDLFIVGIHDRLATSFKVTLSGVPSSSDYILWHISSQNSSTTPTIASSGGSIVVTQNGLDFNLEVASAPIATHNDLNGLQGDGTDYYHLNATQFAAISGGFATLDARYVNVSGDTMTGNLALSGAVIDFDSNLVNPSYKEGRLFYDATEKALSFYTDIPGITCNITQEHLIKVQNVNGSPLSDGEVVYVFSANGDNVTVKKARADLASTSRATIGVVTQACADNADTYITRLGKVHGLNTNAYNEGDTVYLSHTVAGGWTTTLPPAPNRTVRIGYITKKSVGDGHILVDVHDGLSLSEINDVWITAPTSGNLISYNSLNNRWENLSVVAATSGDLDNRYVTLGNDIQNVDGIKIFKELYHGATRILTAPTMTASDYALKTITLSSTQAVLYTGANGTGDLNLYDVPTSTLTMVTSGDGTVTFVYVDYNGGSPVYAVTNSSGVINSSNKVYVGIAYPFGGTMWWSPDTPRSFQNEKVTFITPINSTSNPDPSQGAKTVVVGKDSGNVNIGIDNTVIGGNTATNLTDIRNVVIGADAGNTLVGAAANVVIGAQSNVRNAVEYNAIAIGFQAKAQSNSVQVGGAGYSAGGKAYGQGSIAIGYDSDTTNDDGIAIGSSAYSQAVNAVAFGADTVNAETNTVQFGNSGRPFTKFKVYDGSVNRDLLAETSYISGALNNYTLLSTSASISSNFANYTLLSTTASISSNLQSQINGKANTSHTHTSADITDFDETVDDRVSDLLVAGNNISLSYDDSSNALTISANISGSSSLLQGSVACNTTNSTYTINHVAIDLNFSFPTISLIVPTSGSNLFVQGITNRNSTSFDVTLSEVPNVTGYYISWHLPTTNASLDSIPVINLAISNIPSYTTTVSGSYNVSLYESVVYADNANTIVLPVSPTTNESHWIVNTYTNDIIIDGNGKNISVDGINNSTLSLTPDSSLHIHFNTTKNKWYVI